MSLELTINDQIKKAILAKDEKGLRAYRAIKAAILLAKTSEGAKDNLSADDEIKLLQKLVKSRKDSLEIYEKQNREESGDQDCAHFRPRVPWSKQPGQARPRVRRHPGAEPPIALFQVLQT